MSKPSIQYDWCPFEKRRRYTEACTWKEGIHMMTEAASGVKSLQGKKKSQGLPESTRSWEESRGKREGKICSGFLRFSRPFENIKNLGLQAT